MTTEQEEELKRLWAETPSSRKLSRLTGIPESTIRSAARRWGWDSGVVQLDPDRRARIEMLEQSIPRMLPSGARLRRADIKLFPAWAKDSKTDEIVKEGLDSTHVRYSYDDEKAQVNWPPIGPSYHVHVNTYTPLPAPVDSDFERVFIWGDMQAHFSRENGSLVPFHDERAIDVGLQALARYRPHKVVIIGDFLDLPGLGKYTKEPAFAYLMNAAIAYATHLLARIRGIVGPECEIIFIPGNHELRMERAILDNLSELYGLRRPGDAFSVLSMPFLLNFEKFNIQCAAQFPAGIVWLTPDLVCMHKPDNTVAATQVCGHEVRGTVKSDSLHFFDGRKTFKKYIVPGFGDYGRPVADKQRVTQTHIPSGFGRSVAEQAFATIDITRDKKRFKVQVWEIEDGTAFFREHGLLEGNPENWQYAEELVA